MRLLKKAALFASIATIVSGLVGPTAATADPPSDTVSVIGQGTLSPGIPAVGCAFQTSVTFDATFVVITGTDKQVGGSIHFSGASSICESQASGAGSGTLGGTVAGNVNYVRTGNFVTVTAPAGLTVNGAPRTVPADACEFIPTSENPITSFMLVCHAGFAT